jgi:hypothetical protein
MATDEISTTSFPVPRRIVIRDATDEDMVEIHAIYSRHVLFGVATFEEIPPSIGELMVRRTAAIPDNLAIDLGSKKRQAQGIIGQEQGVPQIKRVFIFR